MNPGLATLFSTRLETKKKPIMILQTFVFDEAITGMGGRLTTAVPFSGDCTKGPTARIRRRQSPA